MAHSRACHGELLQLTSAHAIQVATITGGDDSEISINQIIPGQFFGQLSLLFNTRRGVSVVSKGASELLCLSRRACDKLGLRQVFIDDMEAKATMFRRCGAFQRFEPDRLRFLAALAQPRSVAPGTVLIRQGQQPSHLYASEGCVRGCVALWLCGCRAGTDSHRCMCVHAVPHHSYILKRGVCVVEKAHDVLADVEVRIAEIQRELEMLGTYYVYHRDMRRRPRLTIKEGSDEEGEGGDGTPATATPSPKGKLSSIFRRGHNARMSQLEGPARDRDHARGRGKQDEDQEEAFTTQGVSKRAALYKELGEMMAKRDKVLEARDAFKQYVHPRQAASACVPGDVVNTCDAWYSTVLGEIGTQYRRHKRKAEVAKLFPPAIFGEETIINPYDGFASASIIADTWVELLCVNKQQLNQFSFSRENIEDVRKKALVQPSTSKVYVADLCEGREGRLRGLWHSLTGVAWQLPQVPGAAALEGVPCGNDARNQQIPVAHPCRADSAATRW